MASVSSDSRTPSDGELLARLRTRDVEALELLYDRYAGYVLALSLRVVRERQEAEEVVQDVFWQLWKGQIRYEPARGRFATWLYTVARNRSIDRVRRQRVTERVVDADRVPELAAGSDPESEAHRSEQQTIVRTALRQLSDDQRQALELCFYDGLSHREASERLQSPLGTVKSRIRSALVRLQASLETLR